MAAKDSPLKQFEIVPYTNTELESYDISFTNSSLSMVITVAVITLFLTLTVNPRSIIPSRMQLISELMYNFIAQLLSDTVGDNGKIFSFCVFPFHVRLDWQHGRNGSLSIHFYKPHYCYIRSGISRIYPGVTI